MNSLGLKSRLASFGFPSLPSSLAGAQEAKEKRGLFDFLQYLLPSLLLRPLIRIPATEPRIFNVLALQIPWITRSHSIRI